MFVMLAAVIGALSGRPAVSLTEIAADPLPFIWPTASTATEHQTAVGPVVATNGTTTVVISQVGRYVGDAAAAMAFSTYIGGRFVTTALAWTHVYSDPGQPLRSDNVRDHRVECEI